MEGFDDDTLDLSPGLVEHLEEMSNQRTGDIEEFVGDYGQAEAGDVVEAVAGTGKRRAEAQEVESRPSKRLCPNVAVKGVAQEAAGFIWRFAGAYTWIVFVPDPVKKEEVKKLSNEGAMFVLSTTLRMV